MQLQPGWYMLLLNDMRSPNVENLQPVAYAATSTELQALLDAERVPSYSDDGGSPGRCGYYGTGPSWGKVFRKDGPLEWYNPDGPIVRWWPQPPPEVPDVPHVSQLLDSQTDSMETQ